MSELAGLLTEYFEWLAVERGLAPNSLAAYRRDLRRYAAYLASIGVDDPADIGEATVHGFVEYLKSLADDDGQALLAPASIARSLVAVRSFHRFCAREGHLATDPSEEVGAPRVPQGIPKALDEEQVTRCSARWRATGRVRSATARCSKCSTRPGSASAKRSVSTSTTSTSKTGCCACSAKATRNASCRSAAPPAPCSSSTSATADCSCARRARDVSADTDAVFLNARGTRISRQACWTIVQRAGARAGVDAELSPHVLRHSCATHMLDHGADLRVVQELLGHARISTTQVYTKVSPDRLRAVYEASHPRARAVVEAGSAGP